MKKDLVLGVDFGGTKIKAGLMTVRGRLAGEPVVKPTRTGQPARTILADMVAAVLEARGKADPRRILGLGVGSPGPLDLARGVILETPNIKAMHFFPLKRELEKKLKLPVRVNNDANVFVLGESYFGAGRGFPIVYGVTLGTGFGNGLVIDGVNHIGANDTATEVFSTPYLDGIWEDYISGRGVSMLYRRRGGAGLGSLEVYERARRGEKRALLAWADFGMHLGRILACIVNVVDPHVIVVGGSIAAAWRFFSPAMTKHLKASINPRPRAALRVKRAALGDHSGLIGACCLLLRRDG